MATIHLQTLTPVHIGSGRMWQENFDYLLFQKEACLAVLSDIKILKIIGRENLDEWVRLIDNLNPKSPNNSLRDFLERSYSNLKAVDIASRTIPLSKLGILTKDIREQMHSGDGRVLMPGSSLKGAIRTSVWSDLVIDNADLMKDKNNLGIYDRKNNFNYSDAPLSKNFFGSDPNHDIFRLLQVGDVLFDKQRQTEIASVNVFNFYHNGWGIKKELNQTIELIPEGTPATLDIKFNDTLRKRAGKTFKHNTERLELDNLFKSVDKHSRKLITDEINFWKENIDHDNIEEYIFALEKMMADTEGFIVRVGWGSGYRSMTGDWHEAMTKEDYDHLVKSVRDKPKKDKIYDEGLIFPKTLRLLENGQPLGFVKLSV